MKWYSVDKLIQKYGKKVKDILLDFDFQSPILFFHLLLWTSIPAIFNINLPLDTIEGLVWGNELKLGYDKYPPIFPLFTELFYKIFGSQDWAFYLLSQLFVVSSFLIISFLMVIIYVESKKNLKG